MKELQKEMETLKNGMLALTTVIEAYKNSVEILTIKLEELEEKTTICPVQLGEFIQEKFENLAPSVVDLEWRDDSFRASFELDFMAMVTDELPTRWGEDIAEDFVNFLADSRK